MTNRKVFCFFFAPEMIISRQATKQDDDDTFSPMSNGSCQTDFADNLVSTRITFTAVYLNVFPSSHPTKFNFLYMPASHPFWMFYTFHLCVYTIQTQLGCLCC